MRGNSAIHVQAPNGEILNSRKIQLLPEIASKLLDELCSDLGICLASPHYERFIGTPPKYVEKFINAVLVAEGLDPVRHPELRSKVQVKVVRAFQSSVDQGASYE